MLGKTAGNAEQKPKLSHLECPCSLRLVLLKHSTSMQATEALRPGKHRYLIGKSMREVSARLQGSKHLRSCPAGCT